VLRIGRSIVPQPMPVHLLVESNAARGTAFPFALQIVSAETKPGYSAPLMKIESFPLPSENFAVAYRIDTSEMEPGEYLALVISANGGIEWEESFWVLDSESHQRMLDELQDDEFDEKLRIRRVDLLLLLRRKLIELRDEILPSQPAGPLRVSEVPLTTKTSADFLTGGTLPISKVNFGFDCLLEDFMYLNVFSATPTPQTPGLNRSITLKVNETGDLSAQAEVFLSVPLPFEVIEVFSEHSATAQASRRWPAVFHSDLTITTQYCRLALTISQKLRGQAIPDPQERPAAGVYSPVEVAGAQKAVEVVEEVREEEEAEAGAF
jgi:hypothetical protein